MTIRIAMFSGPRNISTTMMRAFENRPDTFVHDEPFYACYLKGTNAQHPRRDDILASQSSRWTDVIDELKTQKNTNLSYSFEKHIAHHFINPIPVDWFGNTRIIFLIRNPREMIASYKNKYDDVAPIVESYKVQRRLFEVLSGNEFSCVIIDAKDILARPEPMLKHLCEALNIPFMKDMLQWPAGQRESDGVWGSHWYDAVWRSTGFLPLKQKEIVLSDDLEALAQACRDEYQFFYERRLTVNE